MIYVWRLPDSLVIAVGDGLEERDRIDMARLNAVDAWDSLVEMRGGGELSVVEAMRDAFVKAVSAEPSAQYTAMIVPDP